MTCGPAPDGLEIVREVSRILNRDLAPEDALRAVVELLRQRLALAGVTIWLRGPGASALIAVADPPDSRSAPTPERLPAPPTDGERLLLGRAGHLLGALDLRPAPGRSRPDPALVETVANLLAPFLDAQLLSEDLANELAVQARELQQQQRLTNLTIDSLPVGLYVVDRDYRIVVWNRKRETGTQGLRREQVLHRPVFEVLSRLPAEQVRAEIDQIFATGEVDQRETEVEGPEERRIYRLTRVPMRLGGNEVTHVITIGEDITERRTARQRIVQSEKLAALGQLAAGVMHEINNPLATIAGCTAAIAARVTATADPGVTEYLDVIDAEVQRCTRIVDRLLDFSRSRPDQSTRVAQHLNAVVEQTLQLVRHHARFKRLTLALELDPGLPQVLIDGERVLQAFMAVMINAADAMERGGTLRVRTRWDPGEPGEVLAEFTDSGPGIPAGELPKIFEPFYTTKPPGRGTGLGLTICYGIIEEQAGRMAVDSVPGQGTTFRIFLPVAREGAA